MIVNDWKKGMNGESAGNIKRIYDEGWIARVARMRECTKSSCKNLRKSWTT